MIDLNDFIMKVYNGNSKKQHKRYRLFCDKCGKDRGYGSKSAEHRLCAQCCHQDMSPETKAKMSEAKKGHTPWNKGKIGVSEETSEKMRKAKEGFEPWNKGGTTPLETRIKVSCGGRGISVEEFDGFKTPENHKQRSILSDENLREACFERAGWKCEVCGLTKTSFQAHHKNSFAYFPEQRFDLDNLACVCKACHREFHDIYGNGKKVPNTKEQYELYKSTKVLNNVRKTVIVVTGVKGSGKTWVCEQLKDYHRVVYVPSHGKDKELKTGIRTHLYGLPHTRIVYEMPDGANSFKKAHSDLFDIKVVVIDETLERIRRNLSYSGEELTGNIKRRIRELKKYTERVDFIGTSEEVLDYILKLS